MTVTGGEPAGGKVSGDWQVSHAVAAFSVGVLASLAGAAAVLSGGLSVFESFAVVGGLQTLGTIITVLALGRRREPLGLRPRPADGAFLLLGAALALGLSWATYLVVQWVFGGDVPVQGVVQVAEGAEGWPARVAVVVVSVILAPLAEELVFRGVLLRALGRRFSVRHTAVLTAAAFALIHLLLDFDAAPAIPALFVVGVVFALLVQRYGRLTPAVAGHVGFNLVGVLALLY
ncbi:MAG: CPBP family intramembrane metalloprotease [Acidimicrobiia bacterium]|nr:CPBP family intramembrane metalloprotease [Acidimicrobiia bacterium]